MGIRETRMPGDVNSENESKSSEKGNSKDGCGIDFDKMRKYIGVAFAGAYRLGLAVLAVQGASGISRAEGVSTPGASDTALALRSGNDLTDRTSSSLVASDQRAKFIGNSPNRAVCACSSARMGLQGSVDKRVMA